MKKNINLKRKLNGLSSNNEQVAWIPNTFKIRDKNYLFLKKDIKAYESRPAFGKIKHKD